MENDDLGNRMKAYEMSESGRLLNTDLPIIVRLDGRSFSKFTKGMSRPFDTRMTNLMIDTTKFLVEETNAIIGYTQSDEISLILFKSNPETQLFFGGRTQKLTSVIAAMTTAYFNRKLVEVFPDKSDLLPVFDCRVWNVPTKEEAVNAILWRELDATKNAISMAAQHYFSHKELQNKNGQQKKEMIISRGVNFENYPSFFKRGSYIRREKQFIKFTTDEISKLPKNHAARLNPDLTVERNITSRLEMPPILQVTNRANVFFNGDVPIVA